MAHRLDFTGFKADAVDKVVRLLAMLGAINADPWLRGRVSLHGGTAINLFALGAPRLSVDIDLNYIGQTGREAMMAERDDVEQAIIDVGGEAASRSRRAGPNTRAASSCSTTRLVLAATT